MGHIRPVRWFYCPDPESTAALGERLGALARPGCAVALSGPLGAGKTVFARGFARGLAVGPAVRSPTFALMILHEDGRLPLAHGDLYRLASAADLAVLGIDEALSSGAVILEWADRFPEALPEDRLEVAFFEHDPAGVPAPAGSRWVRVTACGPVHAALEEALDA